MERMRKTSRLTVFAWNRKKVEIVSRRGRVGGKGIQRGGGRKYAGGVCTKVQAKGVNRGASESSIRFVSNLSPNKRALVR